MDAPPNYLPSKLPPFLAMLDKRVKASGREILILPTWQSWKDLA
jgi:hypothetical protein